MSDETYQTTIALVENIDETVWCVIISSRSKKKVVMPAHLMPQSVIDLAFDNLGDEHVADVGLTHEQLQGCWTAWKSYTKSTQEATLAY